MERENFMNLFLHYLGDNLKNYDILDIIENGYETAKFKCWYFNENDEAYILNKVNGVIICWYKLTHIGRSLFIINDNSKPYLIGETLRLLAEDIKENECL